MKPSQSLMLMYMLDLVLRAHAANEGTDDSRYATAVGQALGRLRKRLEDARLWNFDEGWCGT